MSDQADVPALRWGLLSTARINDALLREAGDRFVAVGSRSQEKADAYAADKGLERAHGSYEALLADPELDAVYIGLPNSDHVPWAIKALQAGKHVLVEKPLTRRAADAARAFDVADEQGLVLTEAFMWRHHPQVALAQQLIADGAIGELRAVRANFAFLLQDPADLRATTALDGGALMDVGTYCLSGVRTLAGAEPVSVVARQQLGFDRVDVRTHAVLELPDGVLGIFDCGFDTPRSTALEAIGTGGVLRFLDPWHAANAVLVVDRGDGAPERHHADEGDSYRLEVEDLEAAAAGVHDPLLGRRDAVAQARAIEAIYASAEAGGAPTPVPGDPS